MLHLRIPVRGGRRGRKPDLIAESSAEGYRPCLGRLLRRRPEISIQIRRVDTAAWALFRQHHYLNHGLHRAAACFMATVNGPPSAFTAVLHAPTPTGDTGGSIARSVCPTSRAWASATPCRNSWRR